MSKHIKHLDITFILRGWRGENRNNNPDELDGAWVETNGGYPFVLVGVGDKWSDDWSVTVMSAEEATQLKDALVEALARIGRMKSSQTAV